MTSSQHSSRAGAAANLRTRPGAKTRPVGMAARRFHEVGSPLFEVRVVNPRGLQAELGRFGPQVVMYAGLPAPIPELLPCWVELSLDPSLPTVLRTGGVLRAVRNPSLGDLLAVIDQTAPVCP